MYPVLPLPVAESNASQVLAMLGLSDLSADEQVRRLIETSPEELLTKIAPSVHLAPPLAERNIKNAPSFPTLAELMADLPGT